MDTNSAGGAVIFLLLLVAAVVLGVYIMFLPRTIAKSREHSKTDAINVCCWLSLLLWPLWLVAMIWAFTEDNRSTSRTMPAHLARGFDSTPPKPRTPGAVSLNYQDDHIPTIKSDAPGQYCIKGVDRATKMDTTWHVQADSEANARIKADLEGIVVASVDRVE